MSAIDELYQEIIIDHNEHPRNEGNLLGATHQAEGYNASCGDELKLFLKIRGNRIESVKFQAQGCAISRASGSIMTDCLQKKTLEEAKQISSKIQQWFNENDEGLDLDLWGDLRALSGVKQFPMRLKCATLAWHTLDEALKQTDN